MLKLRSFVSVAILVVTGFASWALPEPPSWEELQEDIYVFRSHLINGPLEECPSGVWRYDPSAREYEWLRNFMYNADDWGASPPETGAGTGGGGRLTMSGDRLYFQGWPGIHEMRLPTLQLIRRVPAEAREIDAGWAVQGAVLSEEEGRRLGLGAGILGLGWCVKDAPAKWCDSTQLPGFAQPTHRGDSRALLFHRFSDWSLSLIGDVPAYRPEEPEDVLALVSLGPDGSILRGRRGAVDWLRIEQQAISDIESLEIGVFPFSEDPDSELLELLRHHTRDQFFAVSFRDYPYRWTFQSMDPTLRFGAVHAEWVHNGLGVPLNLAAVRELPPASIQTLPIVAEAPGRNGTQWRTTVWLYNPAEDDVEVRLRRVTAPGEERSVTVPAHGSVRIDDALAWLGGGASGDGTRHEAVVVTSPYRWGANLVASARVFTRDPATGGTYGQSVPAVPDTVGYSNHVRYRSIYDSFSDGFRWGDHREAHLILDRRDPHRYRFNVGFVNDGDEPIEVNLSWGWMDWIYGIIELRPDGERQYVTVPAHSVEVVDVESLFPPALTEHWPSQLSVNADRPIALWLSMVDNRTGDATFVPYSLYSQSAEREREPRYAVPAVMHGPGANGTWWRTDLYGQPWDTWTHYNLQHLIHNAFLHPRNLDACGGAAEETGEIHQEILWGELMIDLDVWFATWMEATGADDAQREYFSRSMFPDVTQRFDACAGETVAGALEVVAGSWMAAFSRTYTTREDGGTYGGMLPLYPMGGWPVQHFAGIEVSQGFRINLGLYNGDGEHAITHRVTLHDAAGDVAASTELVLQPFENWVRPLGDVLGVQPGDLAEGTYGLTVLPLDDESAGVAGRSWAFVSLIDQRTGDPTNWW